MSRTTLLASEVARAARSHVSPIPFLGPLRQPAGGNRTPANQKKTKKMSPASIDPPPLFEIKKTKRYPTGFEPLPVPSMPDAGRLTTLVNAPVAPQSNRVVEKKQRKNAPSGIRTRADAPSRSDGHPYAP